MMIILRRSIHTSTANVFCFLKATVEVRENEVRALREDLTKAKVVDAEKEKLLFNAVEDLVKTKSDLLAIGSGCKIEAETIEAIKEFIDIQASNNGSTEKKTNEFKLEQDCFDLRSALKNVCLLLEDAQKLIASRDADLGRAEEKVKYCLEKNELLLVELQQSELSRAAWTPGNEVGEDEVNLLPGAFLLNELKAIMLDAEGSSKNRPESPGGARASTGVDSKLGDIKRLLEENAFKFASLVSVREDK